MSDGLALAPETLAAFTKLGEDGTAEINLAVENMHCAACMARIEGAYRDAPGVVQARANLTNRRLRLAFDPARASAADLVGRLDALGYRAVTFEPTVTAAQNRAEERRLLTALAIAGFAAANVMLLSVSVWSGAASGDMGPATRDLLHWVSALIALPAIAFAGRPFYRSAWVALGARRLNMDVPISLAVLLAAAMSLHETWTGGEHAYFDAAVSLLFFLLVGRYLDRRARGRANSAAEQMLALGAVEARVVAPDGSARSVPIGQVGAGMRVRVAPGDRVPVDGVVVAGRSSLDASLVSGESLPRPAEPGNAVYAGVVNLGAALEIEVTAAGNDTALAEIVRLMEAAEQGRARHVQIADRVARIYAPAVHLAALATFLGWFVFADVGWQTALLTAVAVLIVTCPCALGLAVPVVQVVASGRLFRRGILVKSGDGLERLAEVDAVVFDKTGTLTLGRPELQDADSHPPETLRLAARLAAASRHPLAQALARAAPAATPLETVNETPGMGLEASLDGETIRLGSREWCGVAAEESTEDTASEIWLRRGDAAPQGFRFQDRARADAAQVVAELKRRGLEVELLSGDRAAVVAALADELAIPRFEAELRPAEKAARLAALAEAGRRVLMVGDGLNDAPALSAAHVSISPSSAADVSRTAADFVFQGERLDAVTAALDMARRADRTARQNFALAFPYNAVAVPLAMAGLVTPLIAALAMSASSLAVTLNALRLKLRAARA
ncbi:MAG: heavy metal translocating P-type ATPase [Alphaproteobacteria bacterium]|nr:heavy metal translocating P-type ATPase [Alphaproteobacteria bacterium]